MCAGYGTRLGGYTRDIPKPMLPLGGRPLLWYTLAYLNSYGFTRIAINLHFRPEVITDYFGDGSAMGVELQYSFEEELLGTAGAAKGLEASLGDEEDLLVIYGDLLIDQNLSDVIRFHEERGACATLLVHKRAKSNSIVRMGKDNRITDFIERPGAEGSQMTSSCGAWINSGLQILNRRILDRIPPGKQSDLPRDVYSKCYSDDYIYGFPLTGYRCAIDSEERYEEAKAAVHEGSYRLSRSSAHEVGEVGQQCLQKSGP